MKNNPNSKQWVYFVMLLPPVFWAGNFIVGRAVAGNFGPVSLAYARWTLSLAIIFPFVALPFWQYRALIKRHFIGLCVLSILGISGFNTFAYLALRYTTATNAIILNSFIPILILLISGLFFKESIKPKQLLGVLCSLIGVLVIITRLDMTVLQHLSVNKGDLWMLVAALVWALYSILLKYYRPQAMPQLLFLGVLILLGTLFLTPVFLFNPLNEAPVVWTPENIKAIIYIALFPSLIATLAWNSGMKTLGAAKGGQFIHLMPFIGAILAIVFLGEHLQTFHFIGGSLIALGLWLSLSSVKTD